MLVSDVDGTLVTTEKVLTQEALDAANGLRAAGISLALASSRPPRGMAMLVEPLGLTLPMVGCNGAIIVNPDLSIITVHPIDPAAAMQTVKFLAAEGLDVWVYTETDWFVRDRHGPHVEREAWILKFEPVVVSAFDERHLASALKIVGVSDQPERVASTEIKGQKRLGSLASVRRSAAYFVDVTSSRASKGAAVSFLGERLSLKTDQIATMGDMPNDVLMFQCSGFSIAMGNASAAVQAEASVVTDTNDNNGFAKAVRRYLLQP